MTSSNPDDRPQSDAASLANETTIRQQLTTGLTKIGVATRQRAWEGGERRGLTPTQGQALIVLYQRQPEPVRIGELTAALAIRQPTASVAVRTLIEKGLVERRVDPEDSRAVALTMTEAGRAEAVQAMAWTDFLTESVAELSEAEQAVFQRSIVKMIKTMQERGQIPVSRMCATCTYFRPNRHPDPEKPHHCAYVDAPFGDRQLRLDCIDFKPATSEVARTTWERFIGNPAAEASG